MKLTQKERDIIEELYKVGGIEYNADEFQEELDYDTGYLEGDSGEMALSEIFTMYKMVKAFALIV